MCFCNHAVNYRQQVASGSNGLDYLAYSVEIVQFPSLCEIMWWIVVQKKPQYGDVGRN